MEKTLGRRETRPLSRTWLFFPSVLLAGCGALLGLERPSPDSDPNGGAAGALGGITGTAGVGGDTGGAASGESGHAGESAGGVPGGAGDGGGDAGWSNAGKDVGGGAAGFGSDSGGAGAGGLDAGAAGAQAGTAGADAGAGGDASVLSPSLGDACDGSVDHACQRDNPYLSLLCNDGTWQVRGTCTSDERCNPDGECQELGGYCAGPVDVCAGYWELQDCATNVFEPQTLHCPFGCEDGRCLPAFGDELVVHPEVIKSNATRPWRRPIPVCFRGASEYPALAAVVRDEAERSWGRFLDIEYTGWSECTDPADASRIELEFLEDCESRLGSAVPLTGMPANGQPAPVGICRTYRDASGALQDMAEREELLRFVTRHQLGHVFGWEEDNRLESPTALAVVLRESDAANLVLTSALLRKFLFTTPYGHKPSGSLTTTTGSCVSPFEKTLRVLPCSHAESGRFDLAGGQLASLLPGSPSCFGATLDEPIPWLEHCDSQLTTSSFSMRRARWSTPERCVIPEAATAGSPLVTADCAPVGDPSQAWHFEIIGQGSNRSSTFVRLRFAATGHCLAIAQLPVYSGNIPLLEACTDEVETRHLFQVWPDGQMSIGEGLGNKAMCINWDAPQSVLYFGTCHYDQYWFSSALETSAGLALTLVSDGGSTPFRATSLGPSELPADNQIFDYVF